MDSYSLRSVEDLPTPFRSTFSFRYFNSLQSECFACCYLSDMNMVISAPTGSGKTVLFELCILRLLSRYLTQEGKFNPMKGVLKTIYIAPSKALVQEKLRDWNMKLGSWGVNCLEMTGDNESYQTKNIHEADIILTTPEKFDAVTRHGIRGGGLSFFSDIALVLIDEVHLLSDPRGAALEAVISRIKMLSRSNEMKSSSLASVRFLAVSATIPNIEDLAEWLLVPSQGIKRFGEEMRPVKLVTKVLGYAPARNDFLFERRLQSYIFDILMQNSRGKSALVFCSTRKGAQEAALHLSQIAMTHGYSNPFIKSKQQQERLKEASLSFSDKQSQSCILYGVGYHNGGLCLKDRSLIEGLFLKGDLQILCTTNTLAHGVNLPAHTVVIKSTQHFNKEKGIYLEYDRSMVLQMCGRAGRPPFDDTGTVIIMTRRETVHLYENLLSGCEMVESQLLSCATEHLNAEIAQLTVSDISLAIQWLKCSYLYVRIKKNPENYGIKRGIPLERLEKHLRDICVQKINDLSKCGMIWTDEDGFLLKPLEPGRLMTTFYLKFDTMKDIVNAPESSSLEDALRIVCRSEEIAWIQLRRNEKKLLNDLNADKDKRLRFHVLGENGKRKKRIQTREEKIFVLANNCLTGDPSVHDLSLSQDMNSVCSSGCRIARCMKECFIYRKSYKGALSSAVLAKCLRQRLWDDSPYLLRQLPGIGMVTAKALNSAGINSFETMAEADPRKIEIITGRKYPFGNHIKESLLSLPPKVELGIEEGECKKLGNSKLVITLTRLPQSIMSIKHHYADMMVGSEEDNKILFHEKIRAEEFSSPYTITVFVSCPQQARVTMKADLIFEEYAGVDVHEKHIITGETNTVKSRVCKDKVSASSYSLRKEIYVVDDDNNTSSEVTTEGAQDSGNSKRAMPSMPSFDLFPEETGQDVSALESADVDCKTKNVEMIFDHIRKKSKDFPTLMTSKAMDSSYQPLVLKMMRNPVNQFGLGDSECLGESVLMVDPEPAEDSSKLTNGTFSPIEVEGQYHNNISKISSNTGSEVSTMFRGTPRRQTNTNSVSTRDFMEDVQSMDYELDFPSESDPYCDKQYDDLYRSSVTRKSSRSNEDAVILIDLEQTEVSPKLISAVCSSIETERQCHRSNPITVSNVMKSEPSVKLGDATRDQFDDKFLPYSMLKHGLATESKRLFPSESSPASDKQNDQPCRSFESSKPRESHLHADISMDSESIESSSKFTSATNSSAETKGQCHRKDLRRAASVINLEISPRAKIEGALNVGSNNRMVISNNKDVETVLGKRAFPFEPNPVLDRQDDQPRRPCGLSETPMEVSFLGFKSVFSFLY